jgi:histidinol dehydrogenase
VSLIGPEESDKKKYNRSFQDDTRPLSPPAEDLGGESIRKTNSNKYLLESKTMTTKIKIPVIELSSTKGKKYLLSLKKARQSRNGEIAERVKNILLAIQNDGDKALFDFIKQFDKANLTPKTFRVSKEELSKQAKKVDSRLKSTIIESAKRIEAFHKEQVRTGFTLKTQEGTLRQLIRPLERVALYIPGGHTVYPSTVLMNAIPAQIAGVKEIVVVTPPRGELDPGIAFALQYLGITEIYKMGGAQAIGSLAYGTKSVKPVDKIVGPGNAYVASAKQQVYGVVDIDSIAGPSDVAILADASVDPSWVALDLLAQAEHGTGDEVSICITDDPVLAEKIAEATIREIAESPAMETILRLPEGSISILVGKDKDDTIAAVNEIAPEHLQIMTKTYKKDLEKITNASAIFLGKFSPVALGDYFIGTNHVLPTGGAARFSSPLGVESFQKRVSVAEITAEGLDQASPFVSVFARAEGFVHHALSVERRGK